MRLGEHAQTSVHALDSARTCVCLRVCVCVCVCVSLFIYFIFDDHNQVWSFVVFVFSSFIVEFCFTFICFEHFCFFLLPAINNTNYYFLRI